MHRKFFTFLVYLFALIGFVLTAGFLAVRLHLTDVGGVVDAKSAQYQQVNQARVRKKEEFSEKKSGDRLSEIKEQIAKLQDVKINREKIYCQIDAIGKKFPLNARRIIEAYGEVSSDAIAEKMILAASMRMENEQIFQGELQQCQSNPEAIGIDEKNITNAYAQTQGESVYPWVNQEEWKAIAEAIIKDKDQIEKASATAGIEPRMLVASAIVEQLRLFNSNRELFKKFFEPLKILGSANKISLGIMGIKENTAIQIENNLKDSSSAYYLGSSMESVLDFKDDPTVSSDRFERLSSDKNHYPNYLYGAIYLKEMISQWERAGYDIKYRPEIVGTLFNVGFPQSKPNPDPKVGGSQIDVGIGKYSFGSLAYEFYYSGELLDAFPFQ